MGDPLGRQDEVRYSSAIRVKETVDIGTAVAADFGWNGFQRRAYDRAAVGIQRQANFLVQRGNVSMEEARQLVEVQRNGLVCAMRKPLTPFGRYYSEILKPTSSLKSLDQLVAEKGTIELVLRSVGKSRVSVNRLAFVARRAGPAAIVIDIVLTILIIEMTPAQERAEVTARQVGGVTGSAVGARYGGLAGAWVGATTFAAIGSPSLAIPVVGEITEGGAVMIGGLVGFFAGGWLGWTAGEEAGGRVWRLADAQWSHR